MLKNIGVFETFSVHIDARKSVMDVMTNKKGM